jgi:hypothetical protein
MAYIDIDELSEIFKIDIINIINTKKADDINILLYQENKDYIKLFINNKNKIFLTYQGFIKLIITNKILNFKNICNIIFTAHMGTTED